jgi:NitT/TauT family transport system permease protein
MSEKMKLQMSPRSLGLILPLVFGVFIIVIWETGVGFFEVPGYVLPPPSSIVKALGNHGTLLFRHSGSTLLEVIFGFAIGGTTGVLVGLAMGVSEVCYRTLYPYVIASIVFPKEALAPLLAIWLGFGLFPKVVISAVIAFFPVVTGTMRGIRLVPPDLDDLFDILSAK